MPSAATTTKPAAAALPPGIEVFRAGRHVDDNGEVHEFSQADVVGMAAAYDPALREAPLTVGHPAHDLPAYGWAGSFSAQDGRLLLNPRDVEPQFAEMVRNRRFPKRSLALYSPTHPSNPKPGQWYPRHVAFLGSQPPAIPGLKDIQFADTAEGLVCFSEAMPGAADPATDSTHEEDPMSKELQEQLAAAQATAAQATAELATAKAAQQAAEERLASQAAAARQARHAEHVQFAEGALAKGKLKKGDVAALVAVLDNAAEAPVQFSEGGETKTVAPVVLIKALVDQAAPLVQFGEHAGGALPHGGSGAGAGARGRTDAEIDADARAYMAKHNVQYAEALGRVVSITTAG